MKKLDTRKQILKHCKLLKRGSNPLMAEIAEFWISKDSDIQSFIVNLNNSPSHAFEWAWSYMISAALMDEVEDILRAVNKGRPILEVLQGLKRRITEQVLRNYDAPNSTSHSHNAMMLAKREAKAKLTGECFCYIENWIEKATPPA